MAAFTSDQIVAFTDNFRTPLLGEGKFSRVFRGTMPYEDGQMDIAVKVAKDASCFPEFENEVERYMSLDHPNIIRMFGYCRTEQDFYIVTELASGDLYSRMAALDWKQTIKVYLGVSDAIAYLHSQNLRIGDLKSTNILLDAENNPKLCDFGSLGPTNQPLSADMTVTIGFMDPYLYNRGMLTTHDDVYSFGVVILQTTKKAMRVIDENGFHLSRIVLNAYRDRKFMDMVHESLRDGCSKKKAKRILELGLMMTADGMGKQHMDSILGQRFRVPTTEDERHDRISLEEVVRELQKLSNSHLRRAFVKLNPKKNWAKLKSKLIGQS